MYVLYGVRPALDQFIEGLDTGDVHKTMVQYPDLFKSLFCCDASQLDGTAFNNLFKINLNEIGSNKRIIENRILTHWRDFVLDCEGTFNYVSCFL